MRELALLVNKPYYILRPRQLMHRLVLQFKAGTVDARSKEALLPWGVRVRFRPDEAIGASIDRTGLYDLVVSETIYRLLDAGDVSLDIGANIGYMTSIMAARVGATGRVLCFEPHPALFQELRENARTWKGNPCLGHTLLFEMALSNYCGTGRLFTSHDFAQNRGTASLSELPDSQDMPAYDIAVGRLDNILDSHDRVALMKLDVEGHECQVLEGAAALLKAHCIRDIVFEDHGSYPTAVTQLLERAGYDLFSLRQRLWGPSLAEFSEQAVHRSYDPPSYLATCERARALGRLSRGGWAVLGVGPFR